MDFFSIDENLLNRRQKNAFNDYIHKIICKYIQIKKSISYGKYIKINEKKIYVKWGIYEY